jgi:hypothetical protein
VAVLGRGGAALRLGQGGVERDELLAGDLEALAGLLGELGAEALDGVLGGANLDPRLVDADAQPVDGRLRRRFPATAR